MGQTWKITFWGDSEIGQLQNRASQNLGQIMFTPKKSSTRMCRSPTTTLKKGPNCFVLLCSLIFDFDAVCSFLCLENWQFCAELKIEEIICRNNINEETLAWQNLHSVRHVSKNLQNIIWEQVVKIETISTTYVHDNGWKMFTATMFLFTENLKKL